MTQDSKESVTLTPEQVRAYVAYAMALGAEPGLLRVGDLALAQLRPAAPVAGGEDDEQKDVRAAWVEIMKGFVFQRPGGFKSYLEFAQAIVQRFAAPLPTPAAAVEEVKKMTWFPGKEIALDLARRLDDAEQQLSVLRPGGLYAWKSKYESAEAALREAQTIIEGMFQENPNGEDVYKMGWNNALFTFRKWLNERHLDSRTGPHGS